MMGLQFGPELPETVRRELEAMVLQIQRQLNSGTDTVSIDADLAELSARISAVDAGAEHIVNKDQPLGYAGLDANGFVPKSHGGYGDKYAAVRVLMRT